MPVGMVSGMSKNNSVDYLDLIAKVEAEDRARREEDSLLPEPAGEQVVDYLAVSKQWEEVKGMMVGEKEKPSV